MLGLSGDIVCACGERGNKEATKELVDYPRHQRLSCETAKRLLDANAIPYCWCIYEVDYGTAILHAIDWDNFDVFCLYRLSCSVSQFDSHSTRLYTPMEYALRGWHWEFVEFMMETGSKYMEYCELFNLPSKDDDSHCDLLYRTQLRLLYQRFIGRESACRRCAAAILSAPIRSRIGLPKDVAKLIAVEIWSTRRDQMWESQESLQKWARQTEALKREIEKDEESSL